MPTSSEDSISLPGSNPLGIVVFEQASGRVLASNQSMRLIYGCDESCKVFDIFKLTNKESLSAKVEKLMPAEMWAGRLFPVTNQHGIGSVDVAMERSAEHPEQVWLYTLEHPVVNGEVKLSSRSELRMLSVLLDNTLEYVFFRGLDGHFILANEAFLSAAVFEGNRPHVDHKICDVVSSESADWVMSLDSRMYETGQPVVNEDSLFIFKNGTKHWLQLTTVPVRSSEGSIIGSLSVARDISDLKRTESELRKAISKAHEAGKAKGDFLAVMSHEIRTPINGIIGASELCRETDLNIEQADYVDTVLQCGSTLLSLVNDVLDFTKIEAGQLNLESLSFNPRNLIESIADEFAQAARSKKIELVLGYDVDLPEYVLGDPNRVKQVFYNLVGNAVKFTQEGEIAIRAEVVKVDQNAARVRFSVNDSGIGIPVDRQEAIFRSFTQADMSTTRKYGGSGLGLSICKELVRLMQGSIRVESEPGEGARFEFEIPFPLPGNPGAKAVPFNAELAGLHVLVIDDNETNCELYQQMCVGWGYRATTARDGLGGLVAMEEAVRKGDPYRLILLDQQMPGLNGLDLASLVRSRPDLRDTQIILLSSSLNREESERATNLNLARSLSKPLKRAVLLEVILETFGIGDTGARSLTLAPFAFKNSKPLHVLLVEDNIINQNIARRRLEKFGHRVCLAENGNDAVEAVEDERFDCILMDIQMPGLDGFEATRLIREFEASCDLPRQYIVAMTAHAMKGDRERCLLAGMDNYISKPFRADILKDILEQAAYAIEEKPKYSNSEWIADLSLAERLESMADEDSEDILSAAPIFLKTFPEDALKLKDAVNREDIKECYFMAHTMKGVAGIFRSKNCVNIAEKLEAACELESLDSVRVLSGELIDAMSSLAKEVEIAAK